MNEAKQNGNGTRRYQPIAAGHGFECIAMRPNRYGEHHSPATVVLHRREVLDPRAEFAMACIEKWGLVMGLPDGEDTAGRAKGKIMPPDEVVARACDVAGAAFDAFKERGWIVTIPSFQECADAVKDKENAND